MEPTKRILEAEEEVGLSRIADKLSPVLAREAIEAFTQLGETRTHFLPSSRSMLSQKMQSSPTNAAISLGFLAADDPMADELAALHAAEWGHLYPDWDEAAARREFRSHRADGLLPATLVLRRDGIYAGSVSVIFNDCAARPDLNPWLASLYVRPEARGRGIATQLIRAAVDLAAAAGEEKLYVFTESAAGLFESHGFRTIDRTNLHGQPIDVMEITLAAHPRPNVLRVGPPI
jgi:GNAT superfamily N-acetyltransferase